MAQVEGILSTIRDERTKSREQGKMLKSCETRIAKLADILYSGP